MVALGMLSNQLKEIAKTYNVFVMTSTQLNGDGLQQGVKRDQRMIRGSKAIADKCDVGCIITEASKVDLEQIQETATRYGLNPTHVIDIYKTFHPKAKYTFFSSAHGTSSRTDYMLGHKVSFGKFKKIEIVSSIFSDHNAMRLEVNYKEKNCKTKQKQTSGS